MKTKTPRPPQRTGWCGLHVPAGHVSHQKCAGGSSANPDREWVPCPCRCHSDAPAPTPPPAPACPACGQTTKECAVSDLTTLRDHCRAMAERDPSEPLWEQLAEEIDAYLAPDDDDAQEALC